MLPRKTSYAAFWAVLLLTLSACATLGVPQADTFNKKLAAGYATVTGARDSTATLLSSGKLSASDAQQVQDQLNNARTGLDVAREVHATDPAGGSAKLDSVVTTLTAISAYLQSRQLK